MVWSARGEGLGLGVRTEGRGLRCRRGGVGWGGALGLLLELGGGRGQDREEMEAVSAALPDFDCLIDTARHHVGSSLVEICKRGKHLFRYAAL